MAHAQQVVSYFVDLPANEASWSKTVRLPGFDSSLGTLTQVKLSFTGDVRQSVFAENQSGGCAAFDLTTATKLALQVACGQPLFATEPLIFRQSGKIGAFDGTLDFAGTSGVRFSRDSPLEGAYWDSHLEKYQGRSSVEFLVSALSRSILGARCDFTAGSSTSAVVGLRVDYTYAAIPEPATGAALLGAGALVTVVLWRRRNAALPS